MDCMTTKFDLVNVFAIKARDGTYKYRSSVLHGLQSDYREFQSEEQMIETVNRVLATQPGLPPDGRDIRRALDVVRGNGMKYTGVTALSLTDEQAESLGWRKR